VSEPLRVLVVDDNPDDRTLVRFTLERAFAPVEIVEITDAAEFDQALRRGRFDVVVTDYQLRWTDGLRVLRGVKERTPYTPVIMFTATGSQELAVDAMKTGLDDYVIKAAQHFVRLPASIRAVLDHAEARRKGDEAHAELARMLERERTLHTAAEGASRAKDEFLATLSHELRTPLTSILGWAKILRERADDPGIVARAVSAIVRNAEAQVQLIGDLLDVSQIITGRMRLDVQPVQLGAVLAGALDSVQPAADAKRVTLTREGDWDARTIGADPARLRQIFWNLLSNAVKFTPEGGRVTAAVKWRRGAVAISVTDTGIGFAKAFAPELFTRFSQADPSTTRHHGGLGLGLAIVRHLTELHGGRVDASSPGEHRGATFTVQLPLGLPVPPAKERPEREGRPDLTGVHVLVVDDDADTRELVPLMLTECGATVEAFGSVRPARAALERAWPDVVVTDIAMPDEDGYVLLRLIRALQRTAGVHVGVIALSADATERGKREAADAGFDRYVTKPIDPGDFRWTVARLAGRAPSTGAAGSSAIPDESS
jgi:signal transduction histidine kinase